MDTSKRLPSEVLMRPTKRTLGTTMVTLRVTFAFSRSPTIAQTLLEA